MDLDIDRYEVYLLCVILEVGVIDNYISKERGKSNCFRIFLQLQPVSIYFLQFTLSIQI